MLISNAFFSVRISYLQCYFHFTFHYLSIVFPSHSRILYTLAIVWPMIPNYISLSLNLRTKSQGWPRGPGSHVHVLPEGLFALAGPQSRYPEGTLPEDWRHQESHCHRGPVRTVPRWVPRILRVGFVAFMSGTSRV